MAAFYAVKKGFLDLRMDDISFENSISEFIEK